MLRISDVSYRYKTRKIPTLKHLSLHVTEGEMLLLAGCSGCGKSTLIKAVSGLLNTAGAGELDGKIYLNNKDTAEMTPEDIGILVGTVYQSPDDQLFAMTVSDEVGFALENQGLDENIISVEVQKVLERVGLAGFEQNSIHTLSGGQRQRLALASVLITKPKLLVLDEPVSQMNPQGVEDFLQLLVSLNRIDGITIIVVEHRVNELAKYFPRLAVMFEGEVIYDGPIELAWQKIGSAEKYGLREPQKVKLCRFLNLSKLIDETSKVVDLIKSECKIEKTALTVRSKKACSEAIVTGKAIRYRYPGSTSDTLQGIDFELYKGETVALMGFNGAGKSTIIKCIMGFLKYQGQIQVNGLENKSIEAKKIMGYIPEIPSLYPNLTVDEHMEFIARAYKLKDYKAYKDALLERFDLTDKKKKFGDELSKGMQQKLSICCGLLPKPRLVLFDEPMIGLDPHAIKELKKVFEELRDSGCMVLVSTHMIDSMEELWDTTYIMKQGRVAAVVERENLKDNNKSLEDIFFEITEGAALEREV